MTTQKKNSNRTSGESGSGKSAKSNVPALPVILLLLGAGVLVWLVIGALNSPETPATATTETAEEETVSDDVAATPDVVAAPEVKTIEEPEPLSDDARQRLLGKWTRTDNPPYSIVIRSVELDGVTDAQYFNPRPINVAGTSIASKDGKIVFFMKMQDRGYEGSTYALVYDETQDSLVGEYFQATQKQTYAVAFQRSDE